jgi:hypothetical protein
VVNFRGVLEGEKVIAANTTPLCGRHPLEATLTRRTGVYSAKSTPRVARPHTSLLFPSVMPSVTILHLVGVFESLGSTSTQERPPMGIAPQSTKRGTQVDCSGTLEEDEGGTIHQPAPLLVD